jgi:hypothetical protein
MTLFSALCLSLSILILYFVLRYRIHIHVTCQVPGWSRKSSRRKRVASYPARNSAAIEAVHPSIAASDLASALVNLGARKRPALAAAVRAIEQHPDASFDLQFSVALQQMRGVS